MEKIKLIFKFICFIIKRLLLNIVQLFNSIPKRISKIIISVVVSILVIFVVLGGSTAIVDCIRFKNNKEPIFAIKTVDVSPLKVTYKGLGYKIVRFPMVTEKEPFRNCLDAKFGTWFMKYEYEDIKIRHILVDIVDRTKEDSFPVVEGTETFFEDDKYIYQFPWKKGMYVLAHFKDGEQSTVGNALNKGDITIKDLDEWNIEYIKTEK